MAASYRVTALDLLRTQASSEEENKRAVALATAGPCLTHVLGVCCAVALLVAYTDAHWQALWQPLVRLDAAFRKELTDMLAQRSGAPSSSRR